MSALQQLFWCHENILDNIRTLCEHCVDAKGTLLGMLFVHCIEANYIYLGKLVATPLSPLTDF